MKVGGYQIVEISTGNVGMYEKLKSAYESNKPILVKKSGSSTFGNVTKDGNYFVANYIIDDVLHQDTISQLDAITEAETDIGSAGSEIDEITNQIKAVNFNTLRDISSYDGSTTDKIFEAPTDGYIVVRLGGTAGITSTNGVTINGSREGDPNCVLISSFESASTTSLFVKKGTCFYVASNTGTNNLIGFRVLL